MDNLILISYHGQMRVAIVLENYKVSIVGTKEVFGSTIELNQCQRCGFWQSEDEEMYSDPDGNGFCDSCSEYCQGCDQYFCIDDTVNSISMVDGVDGNRCCIKCSKKIISIVWSIEDVFSRAKELHYNIIEQQAIEILHNIEKNYDCNHGITWDTIDYHICQLGKDISNDR